MKKEVLLVLILFVCNMTMAQIPQGFNYQAIARDESGNPIANATIKVKLSILTDTTGFYASGMGIYVWEEEQTNVKTNAFGLFTVVLGNPLATKIQGSAARFSSIVWASTPLFIGTKIANPTNYKNLGSAQLWSVPYSMVAGNLNDTLQKLIVKGETTDMEEALFEVKNKNGQTVFAVYNEGVRIYVADGVAKGATKGGFAIGGFGTVKTPGQEYLRVTPDSTRIYIDNTTKGATKGGFAIGGFNPVKGTPQNYLVVNPDSIRAYIDTNPVKGTTKGGFAIGGFDQVKGINKKYMSIDPDSTNFYVRTISPNVSSTFNILGIDQNMLQKSLLAANTDTINVYGVMNLENNLIVNGNLNVKGIFTKDSIINDNDGNTYKTIQIGTQLWMAENLRTTKYNDGTPITNITDAVEYASLTTGAYSDYDNNPTNSATYGRLYNWYAVDNYTSTKEASNGGKNICPTGWHVPSRDDWTTLQTYLGGESIAGDKLRETGASHWTIQSPTATNETGFTALPGGGRYRTMSYSSSSYHNIGISCIMWSSSLPYSSLNTTDAVLGEIWEDWPEFFISSHFKENGFSVRCIKDN